MSEVAILIREILREEIERLPEADKRKFYQKAKSEIVKIQSSEDLNAFARQLAKGCEEESFRNDILSGRREFQLDIGKASSYHSTPITQETSQKSPVEIEKPSADRIFSEGILTEMDIRNLSEDTSVIQVGKTTRFTPLAQDEIRRRGIKVERTRQ